MKINRQIREKWAHQRVLFWATLCLVWAAACSGVVAQPVGSVTDGVRLPTQTVTGMDGVLGLESNPGSLGFLNGSELALQYTEHGKAVGSGAGLFAGTRLFGPLRVGVDLQYLRAEHVKMGFGLAYAPSKRWSVGMTYHGLLSETHDEMNGIHRLDLGFQFRPTDWLAIGAAAHDLTSPEVGGEAISRSYDLGVAFRPGTDRLTLAADVRFEELTNHIDPSATILTTPVNGLYLGATARFLPREAGLGIALSASLGFNWSWLGVASGTFLGMGAGEEEVSYDGIHVGARFSKVQRPSLVRRDGIWVRVTLGRLAERDTSTILGRGRATQLRYLRYLESLREDSKVEGVLVVLRGYGGSWAQAEEIRSSLMALRASGKRVYVYFEQVTGIGYYLATGADQILANPAGGAWLIGLASAVTFYHDLIESLGVNVQVAKIGKYKSFPESFVSEGPSKALSFVKNEMLDILLQHMGKAIAEGREKTLEESLALFQGGPYTSADLLEHGLADAVIYEDQIKKKMGEIEKKPIRFTPNYRPENPMAETWGDPDRIAVITVEGSIVDGNSRTMPLLGTYMTGARSVNKLLDGASRDRRIKAIVIRVNSPGGAAFGSEQMYRKIRTVRKRKPVIISLGGVAASGGYFLAAAGDRIFAQPGTITGSIGIFTMKVSMQKLLGWVGINEEIWKRGENADFFITSTPWTDAQQTLVQKKLSHFYDRFIGAVAEGRSMKKEEVHEVAQGRVWLGSQALEKGLVDEIGGLDAALHYAAEKVGLADDGAYQVVHYPRTSWKAALRNMVVPKVMAGIDEDLSDAFAMEEEWPQSTLRDLFGPLLNLSPYQAGEPLFMLPFHIELDAR